MRLTDREVFEVVEAMQQRLAADGWHLVPDGCAWMDGKIWRFERSWFGTLGEVWLRTDSIE